MENSSFLLTLFSGISSEAHCHSFKNNNNYKYNKLYVSQRFNLSGGFQVLAGKLSIINYTYFKITENIESFLTYTK